MVGLFIAISLVTTAAVIGLSLVAVVVTWRQLRHPRGWDDAWIA